MRDIISIGECMVELARRADLAFDLNVGGDTFNTAVYLSRLGAPVAYMTAVGDDPYSAQIIEAARREGIGTDMIAVVPGRMPGLYLIESHGGERRFWYWRDRSPARELLELPGADARFDRLAAAGVIYLSGITLSLYSATGLDRLEDALRRARARGARVAIDGNFRPVGWHHDIGRAREIYARFKRLTDFALPSFDDEQVLWGDTDPSEPFARLKGFGVAEVCLKMAGDGAMIDDRGALRQSPPVAGVKPVDTTAAGDSFSAAYLWARLNGQPPEAAACAGHRLAAIVIQHRGAIAPLDAMAGLIGRPRDKPAAHSPLID